MRLENPEQNRLTSRKQNGVPFKKTALSPRHHLETSAVLRLENPEQNRLTSRKQNGVPFKKKEKLNKKLLLFGIWVAISTVFLASSSRRILAEAHSNLQY